MLRGLDISNLLLIDRLELTFQPGLNVLTGETGAGKSILLDALGFVLGWRGRAELVRQGATQGEVTAWFDLPQDHPGRQVLREAGLPEEDELILRRVNTSDGRKTAWVNDRRCSGEVLRALSETLVELHGQHDDRGLLNPRGHRDLLDAYGGISVEAVRVAWNDLRDARSERDRAAAQFDAMKADEDFLRHAVSEIEALSPQAGEEAELDTNRRIMQGAERVRTDVLRASEALGADGAEMGIRDATRWLEEAASKTEDTLLDAPLAALSRAMIELDDACDGVRNALDQMTFDPENLEQTEERLFAIRALARKHSVAPDELYALGETLKEKVSSLDTGDADLKDLDQRVDRAQSAYDTAASDLSRMRQTAASALDAAVMRELEPLKMERAVFKTEVTSESAGPSGADAVSFSVATNPGAPAGPLAKIASGGELSRFLLALKVCLHDGAGGKTVIFDEIDRGVGGATADAVGRRLATLAQAGQVLVVTHSPQVAALGAHHWRVEKNVTENVTTSTVVALSEKDRIDEIARMISGDTVTHEARGAAKALLATALTL